MQVAAFMTETLVSSWLATTVRLAGSNAMASGPKPTVTVGGVCPQPVAAAELQVAPLITDMVPDPSPFSKTILVGNRHAWRLQRALPFRRRIPAGCHDSG